MNIRNQLKKIIKEDNYRVVSLNNFATVAKIFDTKNQEWKIVLNCSPENFNGCYYNLNADNMKTLRTQIAYYIEKYFDYMKNYTISEINKNLKKER